MEAGEAEDLGEEVPLEVASAAEAAGAGRNWGRVHIFLLSLQKIHTDDFNFDSCAVESLPQHLNVNPSPISPLGGNVRRIFPRRIPELARSLIS